MTAPDPGFVAASRRRDLLLTLVMLAVLLTPAWLAPRWLGQPLQIAVILLAGPVVVLTWTHAPWVPTPRQELDRMVAALDLKPTDHFCDLGAGDGRMVVWVRAATGATCTGIEASVLLLLVAKVRLALQGDAGTSVRLGNLYRADLSAFDAVYVWGTAYSVGTPAFRAFVEASLRPGARLVSYHTPIPGWTPTSVDERGLRPVFAYTRAP